ncbi:class I SAM-dependent methyltransferase [Acetivibrio mesophilus]|uniref:Class I SAM-dependent methyltransferase n=1 Tax=Acetivibrio mesophilus TaxID=2487273 RepID=A0A4Q0I293_9FIRM|nr:class I SAM-dependent methyltransferase [Acetivibrio mesophilus]ODM26716.1 16S rRNA methyltransferase [Clostridium sp. Bc-iso-3]RXE58261.1 class I SAM-dependent methyltransferase [Acetivibrio mesophilus]
MNHYYTESPDTPHDIGTINYTVKDSVIKLNTDAGVFSKKKVDFGSDLLIRSIPPIAGNILDIGCGYGVIGISLALLNPNSKITMIDINERAVDLASENIRLNGIANANVLKSDGFSNVTGTFEAIVSNPPIRTGKKVIYPIFENSINFLNPGGSIYLVIQKKQGANSAIDFLKSVYGNCEVINKKGGYWIIKSTKE